MYVMYADMQDCVWSCRFLVIRFHRSNFGNKIRLTDDPGVALSAFHFFFLGEDKGGDGPTWSRKYADKPDKPGCDELVEVLLALDSDRMILGHTRTSSEGQGNHHNITVECDGRLILIDTSLSRSVFQSWFQSNTWDCSPIPGPLFCSACSHLPHRSKWHK